MAQYTIELYRLDISTNQFVKIDVISTYANLMFRNKLNGIGECQFSMEVQDPKLNRANFIPFRTQVVVKRDGVIVFVGPFYNYDGTYKDVKGTVTIRAFSYLFHLARRYTDKLRQFTSLTEQTALYWTLINEVQSRTNGSLKIIDASTATGITRYATFEYKSIADALIQQSDNINGFDFDFIPVVDANGNLSQLNFTTYYPRRGAVRNDLPGLIIGDNVQNFGFGVEGDITTSLILEGGGFGSPLISTRNDSDIQLGYTRVEAVVKRPDISEPDSMEKTATAIYNLSSVPLVKLKLELNPSVRPTFGEFGLGDTLNIDLQVADSDLVNYAGQARIVEWVGILDDVGKETIVPTLEYLQ